MSSKEEENMTVLTFHDAYELLDSIKRKLGGFRSATQRRIYEYLQKFTFMTKDEAEHIIKQLEDLGIPKNIAIQIAYILPVLPEEVNPFISQMRQAGMKIENKNEIIENIIKITRPIWEEKKETIISLRNLSISTIKKLSEELKIK